MGSRSRLPYIQNVPNSSKHTFSSKSYHHNSSTKSKIIPLAAYTEKKSIEIQSSLFIELLAFNVKGCGCWCCCHDVKDVAVDAVFDAALCLAVTARAIASMSFPQFWPLLLKFFGVWAVAAAGNVVLKCAVTVGTVAVFAEGVCDVAVCTDAACDAIYSLCPSGPVHLCNKYRVVLF